MDRLTLQLRLSAVPEPIKIWLGSDVVIDVIEDLYKKFNLDPESRAVPKLLLRLEIQDLAARNFWAELASQLKLSKESAKPVIEEIRGRILNPIRKDLEAIGVKLDELDIFEAAPAEHAPKGIPTPAKIPTEIAAPTPPKDSAESAMPPMDLPFTIIGDAPAAAPKPLGALPIDKPAPITPTPLAAAPIVPPPVAMPGATSFDNNSGIKPVEQKRGIRFSIPGVRFGEMKAGDSPARNAQLEIGKKTSPLVKNLPSSADGEVPRVVHYSQWNTAAPAASSAGSSTPKEATTPGAPLPFSQLAALGNTPKAGSPAPALKPSISPISVAPPSAAIPTESPKPATLAPSLATAHPLKDSSPETAPTPITTSTAPSSFEPSAPAGMDKRGGFLAKIGSAVRKIAPAKEAQPTPKPAPVPPPQAIPAPSFKSSAVPAPLPPPPSTPIPTSSSTDAPAAPRESQK